jgi:hypothetical protein
MNVIITTTVSFSFEIVFLVNGAISVITAYTLLVAIAGMTIPKQHRSGKTTNQDVSIDHSSSFQTYLFDIYLCHHLDPLRLRHLPQIRHGDFS